MAAAATAPAATAPHAPTAAAAAAAAAADADDDLLATAEAAADHRVRKLGRRAAELHGLLARTRAEAAAARAQCEAERAAARRQLDEAARWLRSPAAALEEQARLRTALTVRDVEAARLRRRVDDLAKEAAQRRTDELIAVRHARTSRWEAHDAHTVRGRYPLFAILDLATRLPCARSGAGKTARPRPRKECVQLRGRLQTLQRQHIEVHGALACSRLPTATAAR